VGSRVQAFEIEVLVLKSVGVGMSQNGLGVGIVLWTLDRHVELLLLRHVDARWCVHLNVLRWAGKQSQHGIGKQSGFGIVFGVEFLERLFHLTLLEEAQRDFSPRRESALGLHLVGNLIEETRRSDLRPEALLLVRC
jgi:hypothetical protein